MSSDHDQSITGVPIYPDIKLYCNILLGLRIWEGDGWKEESLSWKNSCYLHAGLNGPYSELTYKGPDAQKLLSAISINDCYNWPIGRSKHLVMCDEKGLVANHVLTVRDSDDTFRSFRGFPWAIYHNIKLKYDVQTSFREIFILQVAGPTSLQVLEQVTGENLRDVTFLAFRPTKIPGVNAPIEVSRIGMAGTLAYELRGPIEAGPTVYDAVYKTGRPLGIKRLGWRAYVVNHTEGGFPQLSCTFTASCTAYPEFMSKFGATVIANMSGSVDPANVRARYRTPSEVGWGWMANFNHDFIGRGAVKAELANPRRTIVTLRWNPDDVLDTYASLLKPGTDE